MGDRIPIVIVTQPKLASQEDITEEGINVISTPTLLDDPIFEPLKNSTSFRIKELITDRVDSQDDEENQIKYVIKNVAKKLHYVAKQKLGENTSASCHDGQQGCDINIETVQGEPVITLEGVPGYSGLAHMKVTHGGDLIGEIVQNYDCCSPCNPQYTLFRASGEELLHIAILDGGCCCGIFGVRKFMVVSSCKEVALGKIDDESQRIALWRRKLLADEKSPVKEIKVVLTDSEKLDLEAKVLLLAAAFTVHFHNNVFRFQRRVELPEFQPL